MSQVDDWADGYADSARDVNLYGPASANVPRSSVVSHQVRYQPPVAQTEARTNDTPMYTEDDARGAYAAPASGYRAPAGGGWDVNSSDANLRFSNESGGKQYRVSRTQADKKPAKKQAQSVKKRAQPGKKQAQDYGSYKDQSDPLSQHILANGSSGEAASAESVASAAKNATGQSAGRSDIDLSGLPRERSDMTPLPGDDWSPVDKAGAGINPYESAESLAAWKALKLKSFPILPSEMSGGVPDASVTRFRQIAGDPNSTVADVLSAENEAKKAAIDEGMTMDDIAAFEKEVALNLLFAGAGSVLNALRGVGGAARAASSTGNVWAEGSRAAAGDATAGAKAFEEALSRMNGGAVRGAPVEGTARSSFSSAGTTTGQSAGNRSFGFDLSPEEVARAKATHSAYVNGAAGRGTATGTEAAGSAGEASAGSGSFRFDLSPEDIAAANAANAVARQQAANLSELRGVLIRSGMPDREIAAYMREAGFYNNPEALQQAVLTVRKHGMSGLFTHSAEEAAAAGTYIPKYGRSPLEIWQQERAVTEAANAKFRDMFGFSDVGKLAEAGGVGRGAAAAGGQAAGRGAATAGGQAATAGRAGEAAADGGVSELANAGNAGRETAAGAATGSVSEGVDSASQQLIEHIRSGALDEMERAWIEAIAAGAAKAPGTVNASTQAILNEARAAGILGRDAAGTAGANGAAGAARGVP